MRLGSQGRIFLRHTLPEEGWSYRNQRVKSVRGGNFCNSKACIVALTNRILANSKLISVCYNNLLRLLYYYISRTSITLKSFSVHIIIICHSITEYYVPEVLLFFIDCRKRPLLNEMLTKNHIYAGNISDFELNTNIFSFGEKSQSFQTALSTRA